MTFALAPEAQAAGYRLATYETIGSTSTEAMTRLRAGEPGPLWAVSRHQTAGRGRRGSPWQGLDGNLFASLGLRLDGDPATIATLGFAAGVAVVRALDAVAAGLCASPSPLAGEGGPRVSEGRMTGAGSTDPSSFTAPRRHPGSRPGQALLPLGEKQDLRFTLKWPNDVLADGAKLAGILLEAEQMAAERLVVVGIGINVAELPDGLPYRAASLRSLGFDVAADTVFEALSVEWARTFALWDGGRGFPAIREAWLRKAAGLGGPVTVRSGTGAPFAGVFETIDAGGQLVIAEECGRRRVVPAGEVHFGVAATLRPEAVA